MPKKLKVLVKSLYSHEIRKDVSLETLKSLKLEDAWPFIRDEIEIEIGSNQLVCIPHITEADLYKCTSLFVPNEKETRNGKMFTPLGELSKNINKAKSNSGYVKWLEHGEFQDADFKFPHESVKITLQDETIKNKVRVIMVNFARSSMPKDKHLEDNIYLDVNNKDLKGKKSVYMITSVLMAKTIEFRVTRGTSSRIFHLGNWSPLVFGLDEFLIGDDGKLTKKIPVSTKSKALHWKKLDSSDHLYVVGKDEACSA